MVMMGMVMAAVVLLDGILASSCQVEACASCDKQTIARTRARAFAPSLVIRLHVRQPHGRDSTAPARLAVRFFTLVAWR